MKILIQNGRVINPASGFDQTCDIALVVLKQFKAAGSAELNYLTITLGEARITSIDCNLDGPEVQPTERITLAFRTLKVEHATQGVKGSGKSTKTFEWRIRDQD